MPTITEANKQKFVKYLHAHGKEPVILKNYKFEDIVIENENFGHVIFENCAGKLEIKSTDKHLINYLSVTDDREDNFGLTINGMHIEKNNYNLKNAKICLANVKVDNLNLNIKNKLSLLYFQKIYLIPWWILCTYIFFVSPISAFVVIPLLVFRMWNINYLINTNLANRDKSIISVLCETLIYLVLLKSYLYLNIKMLYFAPLVATILLFANIAFSQAYSFVEFMKSIIEIKNSDIGMFYIQKERVNHKRFYDFKKYLLLTEKASTRIIIENVQIKSFDEDNPESIFADEKFLFLCETPNFFLDSFKGFENIKKDPKLKLIEPFIQLNKKKFDLVNKVDEKIHFMFSSFFFALLDYFAVFFIRPRNVVLSMWFMVFVGQFVFAPYNMTIKDNYVQTAIQNHQYKECEEKNNNCPVYTNEKNNPKSKIVVPSFYDEYKPIYYILSVMTSFTGLDDKESFKPNNPVSQGMIIIYKIMGLIYSAAIIYHLSKNFVIRLISEDEE